MTKKTKENATIKIPEKLRKTAEKLGVNINKISNKWRVYLIKEEIAEEQYYRRTKQLRGKSLWIKLRDGRELEVKSSRQSFARNPKAYTVSFTAAYHKKIAGNASLKTQIPIFHKHVEELGYMTGKDFRRMGLSYFLIHMVAKAAQKDGVKIIVASMASGTSSSKEDKISRHLFERCGGVKVGEFKKVLFNPSNHKCADLVYMQADTAKIIKEAGKLWKRKGIKIV